MDDITDLLALTYYAGNYAAQIRTGMCYGNQAYVRLDRSIADLLTFLIRK